MKNIVTIFISFLISTTVHATLFKASFDCTKAHFPIEKKICESSSLAELDSLLATVYKTKVKASSTTEVLKLQAEQKSWIKVRDNCLGLLPSDEDNCLDNSHTTRIRELGGVEELIKSYRLHCQKNEWECFKLGTLEIEIGQWQNAINDLSIICEKDHDGDRGESCFKKAYALEHLGKKAEALEYYTKACKNRQHNEACATVYKLSEHKSKNPWIGLYRNSTGTIFVSEIKEGKISIEADTNWANGHYCGWNKQGQVIKDKLISEIDKDALECKPIITRQGTKIIIEDPGYACKNAYCGARALFEGEFALDTKLTK